MERKRAGRSDLIEPPAKKRLVSGISVTDADVDALISEYKGKRKPFESYHDFQAAEKDLWRGRPKVDDVRRAAAFYHVLRQNLIRIGIDFNMFKFNSFDEDYDSMSSDDETRDDYEIEANAINFFKGFLLDPPIELSIKTGNQRIASFDNVVSEGKELPEHEPLTEDNLTEVDLVLEVYEDVVGPDFKKFIRCESEVRKLLKDSNAEMTSRQISVIKNYVVTVHLLNLIQAQLEDERNIVFHQRGPDRYPAAFQCKGKDVELSKKDKAERKAIISAWLKVFFKYGKLSLTSSNQ